MPTLNPVFHKDLGNLTELERERKEKLEPFIPKNVTPSEEYRMRLDFLEEEYMTTLKSKSKLKPG